MSADPIVLDLGRLPFADAYAAQCRQQERVLAARETSSPVVGTILLVEHDPPVITIARREGARRHLVATSQQLEQAGVTVAETDRGGDITYHGPGQLVVYPILDLNLLHLGLHDYMRLLEAAVIDTCDRFGIAAQRDKCGTGVWVAQREPAPPAKICAMGVRIRRWITMHGLALNVTTNLDHFDLIVPCGLAGRTVTSLQRELGPRCPAMPAAKQILVASLTDRVEEVRRGVGAPSIGRPDRPPPSPASSPSSHHP